VIALKFDRTRMAELMDCLNTGEPIRSARTAFDYVMLAAAAQAAAFSQGPHSLSRERLPDMHAEQQEAVSEGFQESLVAAVEFCAMLAFKILDDKYDLPAKFGAVIQVIDGEKRVQIVKDV
jgi:hypothetical protein